MMRRSLFLDRSGASAAEFALVVPLLLLFIFGIIDAGRFLWETNRIEKATQMGARMAVVTQPVSTGLATQTYVGTGGLTQGDLIPASLVSPVVCGRTSCACSGACPTNFAVADSASFDRIVVRMRAMMPTIEPADVEISYQGSGLGYAGDPNGMEVSPLVTVELSNVPFQPITSLFLGGISFNLPAFRTTLTAEDSAGTQSN